MQEEADWPAGTRWRFTLVYAALFMPFAVVTPYFQRLLDIMEFSKAEVGSIQGTLEVMAVAAPPFWGWLADHTRRPRVMLMVMVAGAVPAFLLFTVVQGMWMTLGAAILFGLFFRGQIALTDGLTFRYIHLHGGNYGPIRVGGSVAFVAWIAVLEAGGIGDRGGRLIVAGLVLAAILHFGSLLLLPADRDSVPEHVGRPRGRDYRAFLAPALLLFTFVALLGRLAMMSYYHFFTLFLREEFGMERAGLIWIIGPVSEIPVIWFSSAIMRRIGVKKLFALGMLGITVRLLAFSVAPNVWAILPLQLLHALTFGAFHCASVTYVSALTPVRLKSSAQTIFAGLTIGMGGLLGGVIGGQVVERFGFRVLYGSFGALAAVGLAILLLWVPEPRRGEQVAQGREQASR